MKWRELIEKARKAYEDAKAIDAKAAAEKRALTAEEKTAFDKAMDDSDRLKKEADELKAREDRVGAADRFFNDPATRLPAGDGEPGKDAGAKGEEAEKKAREAKHRKLFLAHVRGKARDLEPAEMKELSRLVDTDGGYLAMEEMRAQFITKLRDLSKLRALATVISTQASSVAFPTFDYEGDIPTAKDSGTVTVEDIKNWLGRTRFTPHARKRIFKVPRELLEDAEFDVIPFLVGHFATRRNEIEDGDFINGDGVEKPVGISTVTLNGEDAQTSGAVLHPLDVINTVYGLKEQYRSARGIGFLMHRNVVKQVRSLRDESGGAGTGQLMWGPPLAAGQPQTLHGYPVVETERLAYPDATGKPWWILGDWGYYWIVDRIAWSIERLDELYKPNDQIGVLMRWRSDGAPVLKDAFYRLNRKA